MTDEAGRHDRAGRLRQATFEFLSQRDSGRGISLGEFCKLHDDLMPDLREALEAGAKRLQFVQEIRHAHDVEAVLPESATPPNHHPRPTIRGYQIIDEISGGGQGTVFKAIQDSTGRTVAVKVVDAIASRHYARFEREVLALASLNHPGIVGVIDRGRTANGAHFLSMDFVEGCDLDEWISRVREQAAACENIVSLFVDLTAALEAAHSAGIVHRDLKPSNIRVTPDGRPRIIDFGLAHHGQTSYHANKAMTITGNIVGSIPWASPEQASGAVRKIAPASDVYAIGVMLFEALFGQFPYPVDGPIHETTQHICKTVPRLPRASNDRVHVERSLAQIVLKCLAKDPAARFESAGSLSRALRDWSDGRYRPTEPTPRHFRKRIAISAICCMGLPLLWLIVSPKARPQHEPLLIVLPNHTNAIGMRLFQIPAGSFTMGSPENERGHAYGEENHRVDVPQAFLMGATEVTRGQFRGVMGYLPGSVEELSDECPVDRVSWDEAKNFCDKLSEIDNREYRLPTEAEWEYACRAGTRTTYAGLNDLKQIAWYRENSGGRLQPVATRSSNNWGLFDMSGNVAEWTLDAYVRYPGDRGSTSEARTANTLLRVIRGGSAVDNALACRSASRDADISNTIRPNIGFRVVAQLSDATQSDAK